jgi:hypothetical protein
MFAEDLTAFLSDAEFSVPCTLPSGAVVQVIFDQPNSEGFGLMEASNPSALGRSEDLAAVGHGSEVSAEGVAWRVVGVQPDGTGMTRLILERAP